MVNSKLAWGSGIVLSLCFASWVIALGGIGAVNWLVCSNNQKTLDDIDANSVANFNVTVVPADLFARLNLPKNTTLAAKDVALCSRSWRWEWFTLFFQFAIIASGLVVTVMPARLARARYPLANMLSIATVLIMVAVNENITDVWYFWDTHKMFAEWTGVLQKLYLSAACLVAGWILVIIFNLIWIGFALDAEVENPKEGAPITGDVEAAATRK